MKYKCFCYVYIVSMLNIVKKLFIYGFNLFNISKILENIYIYIMCCFIKFCMIFEEFGWRIYYLRIILRMIFLRKNYFFWIVLMENIIYLNECIDVVKYVEYICFNICRIINDV